MKIAFIGQKGLPTIYGGVERHVEELAVRLVKRGHTVTVYCREWYTGSKNPVYKGIDLRYTKSIHTKNLDAITGTLTATLDALRQDFDVIHYHGVGPALLAWLPRIFKPSVKVVVTFHCQDRLHGKWGLFARLMLAFGERAACWFPHKTIAVSKTLKKYVKEKYGRDAVYIPNGVNADEEIKDFSILAGLGLKKENYILSVSRLVSHKATHQLIDAFKFLKDSDSRNLYNGLKLAIVGEGVETDNYVRYLKSLVDGREDIVFIGWKIGKDLSALFSNAKLFVHPSLSEGLPLVVLEAMSYARPVIASNILEHMELISDKRFLFKAGDSLCLMAAFFWALANPEICRVNGICNKQKVEREYNWELSYEKLENFYKMLFLSKEKSEELIPNFKVKKIGIKA